ncbi:MAG: hypothetical protein ACM3ME_06465 [Chloroflexota bacterium]
MRKLFSSLAISIMLVVTIVTIRVIEKPTNMLTWDVFGYYLYLPSHFIYNDPYLTNHAWLDEVMKKYEPSPTLYQLVDLPNGNRMIKYSSGMAVCYAPFFFIAHWVAPHLGYAADGFSLPYQVLLALGGIIWAIIGIFLLRRLLLYFFDDRITAIVLVLIVAGTNYLHLASIDGTLLTHNYLFTLYALLIILTIKWHDNPSWLVAIYTGLTFGIISLIRPSEAVAFMIPLFWLTGTKEALKLKFRILKTYPFHILVAGILALSVGFIQFNYWKSITGEWLYYSYSNNPGEGFSFFPPFIIEFLVSFRKGWFIYTPVMIAAVTGIIVMLKKYRENTPAIIIFLILDLWIISAWTAWWYGGGSFSSRSIIPAYTLLAIPLGYLVKEVSTSKLRIPAIITGIFLILLNLLQSWQFQHHIIDKERMTADYYFAIFGKLNVDKAKLDHLLLVDRGTETDETPKHIERYTGHTIFTFDIPADADTTIAYKLDANNPFSKGIDIPFNQLTHNDHVWIRTSAEVWIGRNYSGPYPMLVNSFHYKGEAYKYRGIALNDSTASKGGWNKMTYWYLTPEVRTKDDNLKIYIWQQSQNPVYVRNMKVEVFELKAPGLK